MTQPVEVGGEVASAEVGSGGRIIASWANGTN
jgi:hypothetical protein